MDPYHSIGMVVLAFVLVLLNAFFVLSEFAIVKVRRSRLEELNNPPFKNYRNANLALRISKSLDSYLSATQLGITLSSIGLGWVGDNIGKIILVGLGNLFSFFTNNSNIFLNNPAFLHSLSLILAFALVTFLHVILGEIVPKSIAISKSESAILIIARPLHLFWLIFNPVIKLFDSTSAFFLRLLKVTENQSAHSEEEIKIIVGESLKDGVIDSIEGEIIKNAVDFSDTMAKEIMVPRKDMICLDKVKSFENNMDTILEHKHTRYPYCNGSKDSILGMIHISDVFKCQIKNKTFHSDNLIFENILKEMLIVPENTSISKILEKMKKKMIRAALVVDEYGGTAGFLTISDILNEIMGNIIANSNQFIRKNGENYEVDGGLSLETLEEKLGIHYEKDFMQNTIGGYVLHLFGDLPSIGDKINDESCEYEVLSIQETRIKTLKLIIKNLKTKVEEIK